MRYLCTVYYRTNSGCNAKRLTVEAESIEAAENIANAKVRRQRGVIRIDGGDTVPDGAYGPGIWGETSL
jgi:hypothetical protein